MSAADVDAVARHAARGDTEALEVVLRTLQDDVWRYCYALTGDRELAFEAAQETFVRAVTAIRRFRGDGPVRVWLLVIARRACAQVLRRERCRPERPAGDELPEPITPDASGLVDVEALVATLPPDLRQAFVLTQVLGLAYQQAADVAGCPVGTIRSRVYRSRERLVAAVRGADEDPQGDDPRATQEGRDDGRA